MSEMWCKRTDESHTVTVQKGSFVLSQTNLSRVYLQIHYEPLATVRVLRKSPLVISPPVPPGNDTNTTHECDVLCFQIPQCLCLLLNNAIWSARLLLSAWKQEVQLQPDLVLRPVVRILRIGVIAN